MAESLPTKKDIELLFKKLRSTQTNKVCFDCTAKNPTWASVTYGVFICIDCSAVHRSLGVHLSFVRSTQLDTNWTWIQLRQMQIGGNANAESFFRQHNCTTKDSQQKYTSSAAKLYKDRLHKAALLAFQIYGEKIVLDQETKPTIINKEKDFDFFDEHSSNPIELRENVFHTVSSDKSGTSDDLSNKLESTHHESESKHIIGTRKVQPRRSGIGNRKSGGLGAQKISTNFAEIEKEAELAGKLKLQTSAGNVQEAADLQKSEDQNEQITSLRLVYEDLSLKQKNNEETMKAVDPQKAKQMERLGMGFAARSGISHSALSDMKTIQQENIVKPKSTERPEDNFLEMDFSFSSNSNSDFLLKSWSDSRSSRSMSESRSSNSLLGERKEIKSIKIKEEPTDRKYTPLPSGTTNEAQKKFGSAKSISSDQFFSDNSDNAWERSANLSRFEGSSSISSADYFNRNENNGRNSGASNLISNSLINAPDLDDVRESVRQGVTKVAGRLSSLANGVMSSIQEKYGGY